MSIQTHIETTLAAIAEPLGLDRWSIRPVLDSISDARAYCLASPEYREAQVAFDPDKLQTGDDLDEVIVHEAGAHPHTWPLHALAEHQANALADILPEYAREGFRKLLLEQVRVAGEQVTTDVGHAYLRLLRRAHVLDTPPVSE
jgi:hypothetical protein